MIDPVQELKARAELLHHRVTASNPEALKRLRVLPEFRATKVEALPALAPLIKRKHCLAVTAREVGFESWLHAVSVLEGRAHDDFGTLLCLLGSPAHWNIWSASYEEARAIRKEHGGYLLAYKRQFFITDRHYIETMGLDPEDPDWDQIGRDWARPKVAAARTRLYGKLLERSRPS